MVSHKVAGWALSGSYSLSRLYHVVANHLPCTHGYADDTQLNLSFRPDIGSSQYRALAAYESCVSDVRAWFLYNRLLINDSKTEFLIVGSHQRLSKISINSFFVGYSINQSPHSIQTIIMLT